VVCFADGGLWLESGNQHLELAILAAALVAVAQTIQRGARWTDVQRSRGDKLAAVNLSRSLEDSVTIVEPLMPWTVSGIFISTTLGVTTTEMLPRAIFCYGGPIFSLFRAATYDRTGRGLRPLSPEPIGRR